MRHGILQLELYYPHSGISTSLLLAWIGLELLDSRDNVIFFGLSGLGIIQNKSWLLKSHVAHAQCVKCLNVHWWGIQLFDNSIPKGDQHVHSEHHDKTDIDVPHTLRVHPICKQFWQYPLYSVYRLWQPVELHQLTLGLLQTYCTGCSNT